MKEIDPAGEGARAQPWLGVAIWVAIVLLVVVRLAAFQPPPPLGPSAPPGEFSAGRALKHVRSLASRPRPAGSNAHREARDYVLHALTELGLTPEVERGSVVGRWWGVPYDAARVENIVARLPGSASSGAVFLVAHYDSVPTSPGAADDASGVATLLETTRALLRGPPLRNDVVLLFTDAEEAGALGSQAFRQAHPNMAGARVALNFDTRGSGGPAVVYDTSAGNGQLIAHLAHAAPHAVTTSLFYEVARRLGHATDLRTFKEAGVASLNVGFVDDAVNYHTPRDTPSRLDPRSLQHMGSYALDLARHFGAMQLPLPRAPDVVVFDLARGLLVFYPRWLVLPLALLVTGVFAWLARGAWRAGLARPRGVGLGLLGFLLTCGATVGMTAALLRALRCVDVNLRVARGDPYGVTLYRIGLTLATVAVFVAVYRQVRRRVTATEFALGALATWGLLAVLTSACATGASYYFVWPTLGSMLGLAVAGRAQQAGRVGLAALGLVVGALPAVAIAVPGPYLLFTALSLGRPALAALSITLVAAHFLPYFERLSAGRSLRAAALFGLPSAFLFVLAGRTDFSRERPRPSGLAYVLDLPARRAAWVTADDELPPQRARYFERRRSGAAGLGPYEEAAITRLAAAPLRALAGPRAEVLLQERTSGGRRVGWRVTSPRGAPEVLMLLRTSARVDRAVIDGQTVIEQPPFASSATQPWGVRFVALPPAGVDIVLDVQGDAPIGLRLVDRSYGLPADELAPAASDAVLMAVPFYLAGSTFVIQEYRF